MSGSLRNVTQPIPELYNIQGVLFFVVVVWVRLFAFYYPWLPYGNLTHTISHKVTATQRGTVLELQNLTLTYYLLANTNVGMLLPVGGQG